MQIPYWKLLVYDCIIIVQNMLYIRIFTSYLWKKLIRLLMSIYNSLKVQFCVHILYYLGYLASFVVILLVFIFIVGILLCRIVENFLFFLFWIINICIYFNVPFLNLGTERFLEIGFTPENSYALLLFADLIRDLLLLLTSCQNLLEMSIFWESEVFAFLYFGANPKNLFRDWLTFISFFWLC